MSTIAEAAEKTTWSTWEELLLAFSVKRHGLRDWDAVAMELRSRSPFPALLTAQICREKYRDLQRRFTNGDAVVDDADGGGGDVVIPWLDDLRQLRVAELRQEVHRHDLSIQSLQLKVKRMVEERERSGEERREAVIEPDLADCGKADLPAGGGIEESEEVAGEVVSGGSPDHENRSVNESNSAENTETEDRRKPDPVQVQGHKPDPQKNLVGEEDSCKDSSNRHEASKASQKSNADDVSNDVARDGGDVESSASLTKKRRKRPQAGGGAAARSPAIVTKAAVAEKSEPLIALLGAIRAHKHGTAFKRRLQVQKTERYKRIIRRHVDLETVQARLDDGSYSSCPAKFYLDLLLLFNNAIVFFPNSSPESVAAHELRALVTRNLKTANKKNPPSPTNRSIPAKVQPKSEPDNPRSLLSKGSSPRVAPIVVCRKRSTVSATTAVTKSTASADETSQEFPDSLDTAKRKERHVTGVRSMRTGNKGRPSGKKPNRSNEDEVTDVATEREGRGGGSFGGNDKKRGAADFLKRIKKSSPAKEAELPPDTTKRPPSDLKSIGKEQPKKGKAIEKKETASKTPQSGSKKLEERFPAKKGVGRPRTRGRDAMSNDHSRRPKKRAKR